LILTVYSRKHADGGGDGLKTLRAQNPYPTVAAALDRTRPESKGAISKRKKIISLLY